jgi:hypothetical protein
MAFQSPLATESESLRDLPEWSRRLRVVRKALYVACRLMSRDRTLPCKNSSEQRTGKIHDKERLLQRTNSVATTVARPYTSGLLLVGICERRCLRSPHPLPTTLPYLRALITRKLMQKWVEIAVGGTLPSYTRKPRRRFVTKTWPVLYHWIRLVVAFFELLKFLSE